MRAEEKGGMAFAIEGTDTLRLMSPTLPTGLLP